MFFGRKTAAVRWKNPNPVLRFCFVVAIDTTSRFYAERKYYRTCHFFPEVSVMVAPRAALVQILWPVPPPESRPRRYCRLLLCLQPDPAAPLPARTDPEAPLSLPISLMPGDLSPSIRSRILAFQLLYTICSGWTNGSGRK